MQSYVGLIASAVVITLTVLIVQGWVALRGYRRAHQHHQPQQKSSQSFPARRKRVQ